MPDRKTERPTGGVERELRFVDVKMRVVGGDEQPILEGHAAVFDKEAVIFDMFREVVRPGAFARAIKDEHDVRALFNHDPNIVLGRTRSGTLELEEDKIGLRVRIRPDMTVEHDRAVVAKINRGDIDQMSFAFALNGVDGARWDESGRKDGKMDLREILDVDLYDVSPVTYPAYTQTDIGVRSAQAVYQDHIQRAGQPAGEEDGTEANRQDAMTRQAVVDLIRLDI